jgi:hypothetical protein
MGDIVHHYFKSLLVCTDRSMQIEVNHDLDNVVGNFKATRDGKEPLERSLTFVAPRPEADKRITEWINELEAEVFAGGYNEIPTVRDTELAPVTPLEDASG